MVNQRLEFAIWLPHVSYVCVLLQILTVPCECQNSGTCVDPKVFGQQYRYNCVCPSGYTG